MITDWIGRHEITIFEKRIAKLWKKGKIRTENIFKGDEKLPRARARMHVITTLNVIGWFNYNFECDWPIELSDNKLSNNKPSDNNLASESVEK